MKIINKFSITIRILLFFIYYAIITIIDTFGHSEKTIKVFSVDPSKRLIKTKLPIRFNRVQGNYITFKGINYRLELNKVYLDGKQPTIILNHSILDITHNPTVEQWLEINEQNITKKKNTTKSQ
jgi:hypothetical protein